MKNVIFLLILLSVTIEKGFSQYFEWNQAMFGQDEHWREAKKVVTDNDGNVIVVYKFIGNTTFNGINGDIQESNSPNGNNGNSYQVAKFSPNGNLLWTIRPHTYSNNQNFDWMDNNFIIKDIAIGQDNSIYIFGTTESNYLYLGKSIFNTNYSLASANGHHHSSFIARIRPDGFVKWGKSFGAHTAGAITVVNGYAYVTGNFAGIADNNFYASDLEFRPGLVISTNPQNYNEFVSQDTYVAKFSIANGYPVWAKNSISSTDIRGEDIVVDPVTNAVYVAGRFDGNIMLKANETI